MCNGAQVFGVPCFFYHFLPPSAFTLTGGFPSLESVKLRMQLYSNVYNLMLNVTIDIGLNALPSTLSDTVYLLYSFPCYPVNGHHPNLKEDTKAGFTLPF